MVKPLLDNSRLARTALALVLIASLAACDALLTRKRQADPGLYSEDGPRVAQEMAVAQRQPGSSANSLPASGSEAGQETDQEKEQNSSPKRVLTPGPGAPTKTLIAQAEGADIVPELSGDAISGSYSNIPLPAFINLVFGEQLGLPFSLDPVIRAQPDLVTLRLTEPLEPQELFLIARRTLMDFGVAVRLDQGIYAFYFDKEVAAGAVPLMISGRALPDVPESHRPVFMFVSMEVVSNNRVAGWIKMALRGKDIEVMEDPTRNAVLLKGRPALVEQALVMIRLLDQPQLRGKFSVSIEPAYAKVAELAADLVEILKSEGYDASMRPPLGAVILLPLKSNNQLIVFAPSREVLDHVEHWVSIVDRQQALAIEDGIFTYKVENTQAEYIAGLLNELDEGAVDNDVGQVEGELGIERRGKGDFVVDSNRNALIFRGSGKKWTEMLPVIKQMDEVSPSVLVEVLLAEIQLGDTDSSSFQWLATNTFNNYGLALGTLGLLDSGTSALTAALDSAGETRAILKVLYENKRAEIRSRPRLMVKSGQTATIDVGDEIPVITTSSQSSTDPNAQLIQTIVYRNTGVRLEIKPVVHSSGYVDVEVIQELSEAEINETSGIDSPTIKKRKIQTTVTLRDGGSILIGGLISSNVSNVEKGVPFFGKLPGVGALFHSKGVVEDRRELIVMIIPYVISGPEEAEELTKTLVEGLSMDSVTNTTN
jgi:general secretion pathway protein D